MQDTTRKVLDTLSSAEVARSLPIPGAYVSTAKALHARLKGSGLAAKVSRIFRVYLILRIVLLLCILVFGIVFSSLYRSSDTMEHQEALRKVWMTWVGNHGIMPMVVDLASSIGMTFLFRILSHQLRSAFEDMDLDVS